MADVKVKTIGKQAKSALPESVFSEPFNESLVHETVRAEMNARRQGTHSSLTRGEVAMTGAKAWKQKGTGRARAGALSVPHRRGGGVAFGPKPRSHTFKVNRKARRRALRSALSVHASRDSIAVIDPAKFDAPSTKQAGEALTKWGRKSPTLVLIDPDELMLMKSFRNLPRVTVMPAGSAGVADVIGSATLVVSPNALEILESKVGDVRRGASDDASKEAA